VVAAVGCPVNAAIEAFGDRWSLLVLRDIVFGDRPPHFRALQAQLIREDRLKYSRL
jgi:DNA-binding HxlR family transcriptional regulator